MGFEHFCIVISELTHVPLHKINESSSFRDDLGIDSLQMVNLLIQLSERLGIPFEHLIGSDDIFTVGSMYRAFFGGVRG